jgi:hypothetical protein
MESYDKIPFFPGPLIVVQRINNVKYATCASPFFLKVGKFGFVQGDDLLRVHLPEVG